MKTQVLTTHNQENKTMPLKFYKKFLNGLRWNTIEVTIYYSLFSLHQFFLCRIIGYTQYGIISSLFAAIYLCIPILNAGFDLSLSQFLTVFTKSKNSFKHFFVVQLIIQVFILLIALGMLFTLLPLYISRFYPLCNYVLFFILGGILFFESIRKTARFFLQLIFSHKITAIIELLTLCIYCIFVWGYFFIVGTITYYTIFVPMLLIVSIGGATILLYYIFQWYITLPVDTTKLNISYRHIAKNRLHNFLYQISILLFSSNALVPICALYVGLPCAAIFNLISTITRTITITAQKMFGPTSNALLAHIKETSLETKQHLFFKANTILYQLLYGIILFLCINHRKIIAMYNMHTDTTTYLFTFIMLILNSIDNFFLIYEKFYITEEKTLYLFFFNSIIWPLYYGIFQYTKLTLPHALIILVVIRLLTVLSISLYSIHQWQLKPNWHFRTWTIVSTLTIALTFYFLAPY